MTTTKALERVWYPDWLPGQRAWFEYHCYEGHDSADALVWYHSHQQVTILDRQVNDGLGLSWADRVDAGAPYTYTVLFEDGLIWSAFEDELDSTTDNWCRPDPPEAPDAASWEPAE